MLVSASGGVSIESWYFASNVQENDTIAQAKASMAKWKDTSSWYQ
jgi:hypothetical protein